MTISDLRDASRIRACLDAGETIELRESDRIVAQIIPKTESKEMTQSAPAFKMPDFEARHRRLFGDRVFNAVDDFLEDRHGCKRTSH